jgi:catechol 2,3-dioxygenase-like lactoylglutathione lyase family enzyme
MRLRAVRATGINHVSISARNLEESASFYETVLGMERIPTPVFDRPVQWLRVGDLQLHLFLALEDEAPLLHHIGFTIDDFDAAYEAVAARASPEGDPDLVELPSGQVQLYFRDPAGNLVELNWRDAGTLDRSRYPTLRRLADQIPQTEESTQAALYLRD